MAAAAWVGVSRRGGEESRAEPCRIAAKRDLGGRASPPQLRRLRVAAHIRDSTGSHRGSITNGQERTKP